VVQRAAPHKEPPRSGFVGAANRLRWPPVTGRCRSGPKRRIGRGRPISTLPRRDDRDEAASLCGVDVPAARCVACRSLRRLIPRLGCNPSLVDPLYGYRAWRRDRAKRRPEEIGGARMKARAKSYWRTWPRAPRIPTPRLLAWINHLGTATVARSIVCSQQTVLNWKRGRPLSPERAVQLICNSHRQPGPDGKPLTFEDCFGLVSEERSELRNAPEPTVIPPRAPKPTPSPRRRRSDREVPKPKRAA